MTQQLALTNSRLSLQSNAGRRGLVVAFGLAAVALVWAYWTTLAEIAFRWQHDPQYSHGYLVPAFAAFLLWMRRDHLAGRVLQPSLWGLAILLAASGVRLAAAYFHYPWLDQVSLIACVAAVFVLMGGRTAWSWSWPAVAF